MRPPRKTRIKGTQPGAPTPSDAGPFEAMLAPLLGPATAPKAPLQPTEVVAPDGSIVPGPAPFTAPLPLSIPGPLPPPPEPPRLRTPADTLREVLLAVQFFTRIPITGRLADWVGFSPAMLRASAAHFPAIGLMIGGLAALVQLGIMLGMPAGPMRPLLAAVLGTLATVWATGAFHEDGMADTADGLGGSMDRDRALEIMKDSRVGTYGSIALWLTLATKVVTLAMLGAESLGAMLAAGLAAHGVSRLLPLGLVASMRHVGDTATSKAKPLADAIGMEGLVIAALWTLPALLPLSSLAGSTVLAAALLAAFLAAYAAWRLFRRRLGGFTGDSLGAAQQGSEVAFLLGAAFAIGQGL